jgi:ElaB/YqjD/DUF883 family membrane-anchored ribosome-binding protein
MSQHAGAVSGEFKQGVKKDVDQIRDDLGRLGRDVAGTAKDVAGAARQGVREAGEYVQETVETVKRRGEEGLGVTRETIERNPWASVGIAFGAGLLIGAIMRRL